MMALPALRWPVPALLVWAAAWAVFAVLRALAVPALFAALAATLLGVSACGVAACRGSPWRRALMAAGFPLSLAVSAIAGALPAWAWLLPLALLAALY
ncbi:MAG: class I SAM-dependent methyltransferase, partial [Burkholderiaceae bacterium]